MSDTYFNIGSPVKDFVSSFIDGLETALTNKGYITCSESEAHTKMELNAIAIVGTEGEGGAKIMGLGGSVKTNNSDTQIQKVTVFMKKITELDKEKERAKIAQAKVEQERPMQLAYRRAEAGVKSPEF